MIEEKTGEYFDPNETSLLELTLNLDRYRYALQFCPGKTVLDLGSGAGLGTYLYSLLANQVTAIDYKEQYLRNINFSYSRPLEKVQTYLANLEKEQDVRNLPEADLCIALEVLEHLENPDMVLKNLKCKELVFSVPLNSLEVSKWHKYRIDTVEDVRKLIGKYYDVGDYNIQSHPKTYAQWVYGYGVRFEGN